MRVKNASAATLLEQRNSIAHGGLITYPTKINVEDTLDYARNVITEFHGAVIHWLNAN